VLGPCFLFTALYVRSDYFFERADWVASCLFDAMASVEPTPNCIEAIAPFHMLLNALKSVDNQEDLRTRVFERM
jgi:hypothetical protein